MHELPEQETTGTISAFIHRLGAKITARPTRGLFQQQTLTAVPVRTTYPGTDKTMFPYQKPDSWYAICTAWVRYQSIQTRWDIERRLARLLHRRWGTTNKNR